MYSVRWEKVTESGQVDGIDTEASARGWVHAYVSQSTQNGEGEDIQEVSWFDAQGRLVRGYAWTIREQGEDRVIRVGFTRDAPVCSDP